MSVRSKQELEKRAVFEKFDYFTGKNGRFLLVEKAKVYKLLAVT